ncbi:hypothetical protein [Streptomyces sp. NPDC008122]|uniref:hypothetical protein n=1 Tax=Streptomyces sp. NPDC008122 TaxID=3364810 RepID=UPI0036F143F0
MPGSLVGEFEKALFADRGNAAMVHSAVVGIALITSVQVSGLAARSALFLSPIGGAAFIRTHFDRREKAVAACVRPNGFASAVCDLAEPGPRVSAESPAATTRLTGRLIGGS